MSWVLALVGAAGWIIALVLLAVLPARARRQALLTCLRLRSHVRPYLERRALDAGVQLPTAVEPASAERVLDELCTLADRLTEREREQMALGDTVNMAVSDTLQVKDGEPADRTPTG